MAKIKLIPLMVLLSFIMIFGILTTTWPKSQGEMWENHRIDTPPLRAPAPPVILNECVKITK